MKLRTNLAITLNDNQRKTEAKAIAAPVCRLDTTENRATCPRLKRIGLCDWMFPGLRAKLSLRRSDA